MPRVPPHFKVRTTVANHAKMAAVYRDNDLFALWTRLGVLAIERYADRTNDTFLVHDRELVHLTCRGRADVARKLLRRLADVSPMSAEPDGDTWRITIPNLAEKQGFATKKGRGKEVSSSASSSSSSTASKKKKERESQPAGPGSDPTPVLVESPEEPKPEPPECRAFVEEFSRLVAGAHPRTKPPSDAILRAWATEARRMVELDGRTIPEMSELAAWLFEDDGDDAAFWRANVLAVPKFRKQFDQLQAHRARGKRPKRLSFDDEQSAARRRALGLT